MFKKNKIVLKIIVCTAIIFNTSIFSQTRELGGTGEFIDGIAAIVNDGVILRSEVEQQLELIIANLEKQEGRLPPRDVIQEQVMERLIIQRVQLQRAERFGVRISDEALNAAITNVAQNNQVEFKDFPKILEAEGINYKDYRKELREQLTIDQLRQRDVASRISVSESELESFMFLQKDQDALNYGYNLSHILIPISSSSSNNETAKGELLVNNLYKKISDGENFESLAVEFSKGQQALNGGNLGWMQGEQLPNIFIQAVSSIEIEQISQPFKSASGFHLLRLNAIKGNDPILEDQINVRHILIKTNEVLDDSAAEEKLKTIRNQIINEGDFGAVASAVSEDSGSAQEGGDMGWTAQGFFVPEFESMANSLNENEISIPFKTRYGWHIIEFLGKRTFDNTEEIQKRKAISAIRNSKLSDEIEIWARELRDEAFVEILPFN
jgi:peptidyl-prolyl cis-trans isomerase SurA